MFSLRRCRPFSLLRCRPFSTSAFRRNNEDMAPLRNMLAEEADQADQRSHLQTATANTNRPDDEYRTINPGSFIRPSDLTLESLKLSERPMKRKSALPPATRDARAKDVFYRLGVDPLKLSLHPEVLKYHMSEMAMIYPRRITGLTMKSQRRIAKAIRRAKMMGVIPILSRPDRFH